MKLNEKLIKKLAAGKIALTNDGTLKQLKEVLKTAFPNCENVITGSHNYYFKFINGVWDCDSSTGLPTHSISDFYTEDKPEFERGELVEVRRYGDEWEERIYLATIKGAKEPYICVDCGYNLLFEVNKPFGISSWRQIRKLQPKQIEVTRNEIAAWKGCKPEDIVII